MQGYFIIFALVLTICFVITRNIQMKKMGLQAFHFGKMDKKDFLIPPFVLLYFYLIIAYVFDLPRFTSVMEGGEIAAWIGAALCFTAPFIFLWGMISFGKSFRVGIDMDEPGKLVTTGAFAHSRNPLYVAFFMIFTGVFLIYPTWIFFVYMLGAMWLVDRQVNLEENALREIYGKDYNEYCTEVRRYI